MVRQPNGQKHSGVPFYATDIWSHVKTVHPWGDSTEAHYDEAFKATAQALLEDTYVDDIQVGGDVEEDAATFKEEASNIMSKGGFTLHKWQSNVEQLNPVEKVTEGEETYAKSLVGTEETGQLKSWSHCGTRRTTR